MKNHAAKKYKKTTWLQRFFLWLAGKEIPNKQQTIPPPSNKMTMQKTNNNNECPETPFEIMLDKVCDFGICKQFKIFGYLFKDLMDYLTNRGYADEASDTFRQAYIKAMGRDRLFWESCCPDVLGDPCQLGMPTGFTQSAVNQCWEDVVCDLVDLEACDCKKDNEPPTYPDILGWSFFREYAPSFTPYLGDFEIDPAQDKKENMKALAEHLIGNAVPDKHFWLSLIHI